MGKSFTIKPLNITRHTITLYQNTRHGDGGGGGAKNERVKRSWAQRHCAPLRRSKTTFADRQHGHTNRVSGSVSEQNYY